MKAVGLILAGGNSNKMRELTQKRAVAAMPIAAGAKAAPKPLKTMFSEHITPQMPPKNTMSANLC